MINKIIIISILVFFCSCKTEVKKQNIKPYLSQSVVQDYALLFSKPETDSISKKIIDYKISSTNQICVYTLDSLPNNAKVLSFATELANKLEVGTKEKNNGLLILIAKNDRQVAIATGLGSEKTITDSISKIIISNTIIPHFKKNEFYNGIDNAIDSLISKWN